MDVHWNGAASIAGEVGTRAQPETASYSLPDQFLSGQTSEGGGDDANLEWLSMFMEECLSGTPSYDSINQNHPSPAPPTAISAPPATATFISTSEEHYPPPATTFISASTQDHPPPVVPATFIPISSQHPPPPTTLNTRNLIPMLRIEQPTIMEEAFTPKTKAKKSQHPPRTFSDPPLLYQTQWLADSELINHHASKKANGDEMGQRGQQCRRCSHCQTQKTPQWRTGPLGPKSLCNACGVRFKSGRLYPEYRPAKSPTFETFKHSNSHKRVMEMRMGLMSSGSK